VLQVQQPRLGQVRRAREPRLGKVLQLLQVQQDWFLSALGFVAGLTILAPLEGKEFLY